MWISRGWKILPVFCWHWYLGSVAIQVLNILFLVAFRNKNWSTNDFLAFTITTDVLQKSTTTSFMLRTTPMPRFMTQLPWRGAYGPTSPLTMASTLAVQFTKIQWLWLEDGSSKVQWCNTILPLVIMIWNSNIYHQITISFF